MKSTKIGRLFVLTLVAASCLLSVTLAEPSTELTKRFQQHIEYLASDELEGRGPGSKGIEAAADYIAKHFKEAGLDPAGADGTYFQPFPISLNRKLVEGNRLKFTGLDRALVQGKGFIPLSFSGAGSFSGPLVFCGYGIVNAEKGYDDFKDLDLSGKVALVADGEPAGWADKDGNPSSHSHRRNKLYNVKDRGAAAILFFNGTRSAKGAKEQLTPFRSEGADDYGLPAIEIDGALMEQLLIESGAGDLFMKDGAKPAVLSGMAVDGEVKFEKQTATTRNVLGAIKGTGPQAGEWVVIGAHYDHLGLRAPSMRKFKDGKIVEDSPEPQIHNGADDNASGVSGLIEIARGLAAGPPPSRSILFIAFSAEESGLQGSKYYADHPTAPLDQTVAMLNMDMIGRLGPENRLTVFGAKSAADFLPILESAGKSAGLGIHAGVDSGGRSDHAVFSRKQIPAMHFYSGNHADYHKPSDDTHLINAEGGARIALVVQETARAIANLPDKPVFVAEMKEAAASDPHAALGAGDPDKLPTFKVVMGLSPNYADDGQPGMGVDAVSPDGPAQRAGMKAGDRIIKIKGKSIANIYDYMASTRDNKGGDIVDVVVLREGKEIPLKVTLSGAR